MTKANNILSYTDFAAAWGPQVEGATQAKPNKVQKDREASVAAALREPDSDLSPAPEPEAPKASRKAGAAVGKLNRVHAFVALDGKAAVLTERPDGRVSFSTMNDMRSIYANKFVAGDKRTEFDVWYESPSRREFLRGVEFDPGGTPANVYNLWRGWSVKPADPSGCKLFLDHLRTVICDGDPVAFDWLVGWLAHLVQRPEEKPGVAVVLRGLKGAGKDVVGRWLQCLAPQYYENLTQPDQLTGKFNSHFAQALIIHVEEAFWAGDRRGEGPLKSLITGPSIRIEPKGVNSFEVKSFARFVMTANADWAVPASFDERRFFVLDVSDRHRNDPAWFGPLWAGLKTGGPASLLGYLLAVDLTGFNVRRPPDTAALISQKLRTLTGVRRWIVDDLLSTGDLWPEPGPTHIKSGGLYEQYLDWHRRHRFQGDPDSTVSFGRALSECLPGCVKKEQARDGILGRAWRYRLSALVACRQAFETWIGGTVDWPAGASVVRLSLCEWLDRPVAEILEPAAWH